MCLGGFLLQVEKSREVVTIFVTAGETEIRDVLSKIRKDKSNIHLPKIGKQMTEVVTDFPVPPRASGGGSAGT